MISFGQVMSGPGWLAYGNGSRIDDEDFPRWMRGPDERQQHWI